MRNTLEQNVIRTHTALAWFSKTMRLTDALGGILVLGLLDNPGQALGAILPVSYNVNLRWDRSTSLETTGYRIYFGEASGDYSHSILAGNVTSNSVPGLAPGVTYFFAVTAYNASGLESGFSNEVSFMADPSTIRIRVLATGQSVLTVKASTGHKYDILATQPGPGWAVIGTITMGVSGTVDFTDTNAASFRQRTYRTRQKP